MEIVLKTTIDIDRESYNREYGTDFETNEDIAEFMRESVEWNLKSFFTRWPYISRANVELEVK